MNVELNKIIVASDLSCHLINDKPLYAKRFIEVLKFHPPGLAAVLDDTGAYHIDLHGSPAYHERYLRSFGFYHERAAVIDPNTKKWFHIFPSGRKVYLEVYEWCGNFQDGACTARDITGYYFHIGLNGKPLYQQKYRYAGDFKDGIAVVQNHQGLYTHLDLVGKYLHNIWFHDLDIFHKGFARACDKQGWCHINKNGQPVYPQRYKMVEPFYNGFARVEDECGAMLVIQENGEVTKVLRDKIHSPLQQLSADMVGYWKTQTIKAAVELKLFEFLPGDEGALATKTHLDLGILRRLLRALHELKLIYKSDNLLFPTEKGELLQSNHKLSLTAAATHWGREPYLTWLNLTDSLRRGQQMYLEKYGATVFEWLDYDNNVLQEYQAAMASYAKHDYQEVADKVDLSKNQIVIDAGGGQGILLQYLLQKYSHLTGILLERSAVLQAIKNPKFSVAAFDLFTSWPKNGDAIFLARVLHDWDDKNCVIILQRATESLLPNGAIYIVEMLLEENSGNGGMLDLNMLVLTGGMERTRAQFITLAKQAGLEVVTAEFLNSGYTILKLVPINKNE